MHDNYGVFSTRGLAVSTRQYVQDSAIAASASFAMLLLQQQVLLHSQNDFLAIAWLLLSLVALQTVAKWWTKSQQNATTQQFYDALARADMLHRLPLNGVRVLPLRHTQLRSSSTTTSSSKPWVLLVVGYFLVAAVDAYEYGSVIHTLVLVTLALAMKHAELAMFETKLRLTASPHFHLLSLICACAMALPLSWIVAPRARRVTVEKRDAENGLAATSVVWWMLCGFGVGALQLTAMYFHRNPLSQASSRSRWISLTVCTSTGLVGSLFVSVFEDDWLRFAVDHLAAMVIMYAQFCEMIRLSVEQRNDELQVDMLRSGSMDAMQILLDV